MKFVVRAAVALACLAAPVAANAADYLTYKFAITGFENRYNNDPSGINYGPVTGEIIYNLPTYFAGATSATYNTSDIYQTRVVSGYVSSDSFTLREFQSQYGRSGSRDITIKACLASGIPGPVIAINPSCSSVSFRDIVSLGTRGGDARLIFGTVTGLTVSEGFGSAPLGLISYPVIPTFNGLYLPEPASWAMMILGLGVIGGVLRRRSKVSTAVKFA